MEAANPFGAGSPPAYGAPVDGWWLGCNICCDGSQRSMKIHKAALGWISQDCVCVFCL